MIICLQQFPNNHNSSIHNTDVFATNPTNTISGQSKKSRKSIFSRKIIENHTILYYFVVFCSISLTEEARLKGFSFSNQRKDAQKDTQGWTHFVAERRDRP